jgi:hypothetical protein
VTRSETQKSVGSEPTLLTQHIHEAHYDDAGKLTRQCAACGRDLLHPSHLRGEVR